MKKLLFSMLTLCAVGLGFTACSDDDDDIAYNQSVAPEILAEGTYTGTFTRIQTNLSTATPQTGEGTLTLVACDTLNNIATVKVECAELNNLSEEVAINITYANDKVRFFNQSGENKMKYVMGEINNAGELITSYNLNQRSGRSTKPYRYTFVGMKSASAE